MKDESIARVDIARMPIFQPLCRTVCRSANTVAVAAALLLTPLQGRSEELYRLSTKCSLAGETPQACTVQAINEGEYTLYRHLIGPKTETIRISAEPTRIVIWDHDKKQWQNLERAQALFSTNTICFNGRSLCVVNPNYLNSVRESEPGRMDSRDLIKVFFGKDGRINASCFDEGCDLNLK
jgi:hypothetical protein